MGRENNVTLFKAVITHYYEQQDLKEAFVLDQLFYQCSSVQQPLMEKKTPEW